MDLGHVVLGGAALFLFSISMANATGRDQPWSSIGTIAGSVAVSMLILAAINWLVAV